MTLEERIAELETIVGESYVVIADLAHRAGMFDDHAVQKALDNTSEARLVHQDVIPFKPE